MIDAKDRKLIVGYCLGMITTRSPEHDGKDIQIEVDLILQSINQPILSEEEMEYFETINDFLYLYQYHNSNRKEFRDTVLKYEKKKN